MRHMLHVTRAIRLGLIMGLMWQCAWAQQPVLDLTKTPPSDRRSLGVPGSAIGGIIAGTATGPQLYELPIDIRIDKLELRPSQGRQVLNLRIEIANKGALPFDLPSCLDEVMAHGPEDVDRRSFQFGVEFSSPQLKRTVTSVTGVTFSSASKPECFSAMRPGERVFVVMDAEISQAVLDLLRKPSRVRVRAFCSEWKLEDRRFFVSKRSKQVQSNPAELGL